ncbi:cold-shock protein [Lacticaseibacillus hulanensis]|jgi:CspA family cold shock protein|uniref:cold-shock protein n=1 Tax=Lacticaseibacillus hulanensis TaxID=2493111 RepID=UPI000FDC83BE|nr:cold shock domain-containing protein [Lacticaseibacillus hulanensis]
MIYGTIKWFDLNRGIGVITTDEGTDVFMPYSAVLSNGLRYPAEGQTVALEVEPTTHNYMNATNGLRARSVVAAERTTGPEVWTKAQVLATRENLSFEEQAG